MKQMYDTHCHPNIKPLDECLDEILKDAKDKDFYFNVVGTDIPTSIRAVEIAKMDQEHIKACVAIHPNDVDLVDFAEARDVLDELCSKNRDVVAGIGECGLDFHYSRHYWKQQYQFLEMHVELAKKYNLPLMLHVRDAHKEMLEFLQKQNLDLQIIFHCFSENKDIAEQILKLPNNKDIYFSIPGIVTFSNASQMQEAVKIIPLENMLVETDSPWLTPAPHRGKTNKPIYVEHTINKIAEIKGIDFDSVAQATFGNAVKLFRRN